MDIPRNLLLSVPIALLLVVIFFFSFASSTTIQVANAPQPVPATARGLPLQFYSVYRPPNCPTKVNAYCPPPTINELNFANAIIDFVFWYAISLLVVTSIDALLSRRRAEPKETPLPSTHPPSV